MTTEVCDVHNVELEYREDGNGESGPSEPYLSCPSCHEEHMHPMVFCEVCKKESRTVRISTVNAHFDPTAAMHLECGHVMI